MTLPIGADYIPRKLDGEYTYKSLEEKGLCSEMCLHHLISSLTPATNGVLQSSSHSVCNSMCRECLENGLCHACREKGHIHTAPSLHACSSCIRLGTKCVKAGVLVFAMDSESRNRTAQNPLEEKRAADVLDPYLSLCQCLPDPVHVAKRMSRHFSNWYLIVNGYRINRVQLRTLRNDLHLKEELMPHISVAASRNRDMMDVDSMLEISSAPVRHIIHTSAETITDTIIPEKFRLYEGKKGKGILISPSGVCMGPPGQLLVVDSSRGKLFSARLHYPVDVTEVCSSLSMPLSVAYREGVVYMAEYAGSKISFVDLEGKTVVDPEKMTVKDLKKVLSDLNLLRAGADTRKKALQKTLKEWIETQRSRCREGVSTRSSPQTHLQSTSSSCGF